MIADLMAAIGQLVHSKLKKIEDRRAVKISGLSIQDFNF
jgi:hypothetical protein